MPVQCSSTPPVEPWGQPGAGMWVDYKPVDVEIDDDNLRIFHVFEMQIGMNEFYHCILAVQFLMFLCLVLLCAHKLVLVAL